MKMHGRLFLIIAASFPAGAHCTPLLRECVFQYTNQNNISAEAARSFNCYARYACSICSRVG